MFTRTKDYTDAALAAFGLQARRQPSDFILPALGVLSVGILAGAGLGLLLAPRRGRELREDIGKGVNRTLQGVACGLRKVGRGEIFRRHDADHQEHEHEHVAQGISHGRDSYENGHERAYGSSRPVGGEVLGSQLNR